jgi:HAD superfamily hydrolase (TIGR01509 family)
VTLLIFDCDGVLVDSEIIALGALAKLLTDLGRPSTPAECRRLFMGKSLEDVLAEIATMLGRPLPADCGAKANAELLERLRRELRPVEGVAEAIAQLPYSRCVASSSQPERISLSLAVTGLAPLFGRLVFSAAEVKHGKPAPDLFLYAAAQCGCAPAQCIVIEDSPVGIAAAGRAGMASIGFAGASDGDCVLAQALAMAGAAIVLTKMADLPAAVEELRASGEHAAKKAAAAGRGRAS